MKRPIVSFYVGMLQGALILAAIDKYGIGLSIPQKILFWVVGVVLVNVVWLAVLFLDYLVGNNE